MTLWFRCQWPFYCWRCSLHVKIYSFVRTPWSFLSIFCCFVCTTTVIIKELSLQKNFQKYRSCIYSTLMYPQLNYDKTVWATTYVFKFHLCCFTPKANWVPSISSQDPRERERWWCLCYDTMMARPKYVKYLPSEFFSLLWKHR